MDISDLTQRQKQILQVIVQEYVKTGEPVSSSFIADFADMSYSSATIRNEMSKLEDMGYLKQPHAAAGRIPLDRAYRLFVNEIIKSRIAPPPREAAEEIDREYFSVKSQMESLIERTAGLLSRLTNYTSMILAPELRKNLFKYLKLVSLSPFSILLFMISNTGELIHKIIEVSHPVDPGILDKLTESLNIRLQGKPIETLGKAISEESEGSSEHELLEQISMESDKIVTASSRDVVFGGKNRVFDFSGASDLKSVKVMMELLEEENVIAEILSETINRQEMNIMIGSENPVSEMKDCTLITVAYKIKSHPAGTLGILGPKRMPYRQVISIINYTAENFGNKLSSIDEAQ